MNSYESDDQISKKRSLGKLHRARKTKEKSPDLVGQLRLQRHTFDELTDQFADQEGSELACNIAAWANRDDLGEYLTIEISPRYVSQGSSLRESNRLKFIFGSAKK
jgi:hypothetical protein